MGGAKQGGNKPPQIINEYTHSHNITENTVTIFERWWWVAMR